MRISTARASSSLWRTTGSRVPLGASTASRFQLCIQADPNEARLDAPYTRRTMELVVDRYELGVTRTNCYVVRASRDATEAVVIDPGDGAAQLRLELARAGA